ncbi:hypothetical protein [Corynebacterium variabile]|uniref:hypothetical protein n=1 Tax=Corynebacterium variabile TaxID=1727 RepID=UPI00289D88BA|nr:hypothetical protein [Corynebacterium variabile]
MVAEFWRGTITTRRIVALINGLPEDSALHREFNDGHTWTTGNTLQWTTIFWLRRLESMLAAQGVQKQAKKVDHPRVPWEDDKVKRTGHVEAEDQEDAVAYLMGLSIKKPEE